MVAHVGHARLLQPGFDSGKGIASAANGGHGQGHELHHQRSQARTVRLVGNLIEVDEDAAWFERLHHFFQNGGVDVGWQEMRDVEVEGHVIEWIVREQRGEIVTHDIAGYETHALR